MATQPMVALALRTAAAAVREQDAALEAGAAESGLVVLGSSIGWFQFFGHAFFGDERLLQAAEERKAAEQAAAAAKAADMRACASCWCDVDKSEGAECGRDEGQRHFLCGECLAHYVREATGEGGLRWRLRYRPPQRRQHDRDTY